MTDTTTTTVVAIKPGDAIVLRIGWEDIVTRDGDGQSTEAKFTATLMFPNGPPDLPFAVVWQAIPVRVVLANAEHVHD